MVVLVMRGGGGGGAGDEWLIPVLANLYMYNTCIG